MKCIYNVFDVIVKDACMYLYLGKYKITENNRLIDNYRYNDIDNHIYVEISRVPKYDKNSIIFFDNYMFKFYKSKMYGVDIVSRLPINVNDDIKLIFRDKSFVAKTRINGINPNDIKLLNNINEENYVNIIKNINNVEDLFLEFIYDKKRKIYISIINYFDKKYHLKFINDDFIFSILNPLISELISNNPCRFNNGKNDFTINTEKSFNIALSGFQEEIILYLLKKFRIDDNGLVL